MPDVSVDRKEKKSDEHYAELLREVLGDDKEAGDGKKTDENNMEVKELDFEKIYHIESDEEIAEDEEYIPAGYDYAYDGLVGIYFKSMGNTGVLTRDEERKAFLDLKKAEKEFNKVFRNKELPSDIPEIKIENQELNILDLLLKTKLVASKAEARRLVEQGAVKIDSKIIKDWQTKIETRPGRVLQIGKRRFAKIK